MTRLSTDFWVFAYMARLDAIGVPAHLVAKGDATSGAVIVKVATMDGLASAHSRVMGPDGERVWAPLVEPSPEAQVDAALDRQRGFDPDLWIVEVEDPKGRSLLGDEGLH